MYVELTETSVDTTNNTSKVKYNVYCKSSGSGSISARHLKYFKLNGSTIINETVSVNVSSPNANIAIASGTTSAISHNSDGTKFVSFEAEIDAASYGVSASTSGTFTLSNIPRKSTISATSANIGSNSTVTINKANSSFTHTLTYSFGSLSGTIATKTSNSSVSWTLPDTFYAQIPNAKSGTGTITCTTYNGNTSLGSTTCSFTANAVESAAKPTVTATVTDINSTTTGITGDNTKLILNASTARIVITSTLRKNAGSIKSVTINGSNVGTSASITKDYANVTTGNFTIVTTDSRGYTATVTLTPATINYVPLTLNAQIYRTSPTTGEVAINYNGNYYNGSFGSTNNTLTVSYKYKLSTDSSYTTGTDNIDPIISGNTYSKSAASLGSSFAYNNSYNFVVTASDRIKTVTYSVTINQGRPVFYWGKDFFTFNTKTQGNNWEVDANGNAIFNTVKGNAVKISKNSAQGYGLTNTDNVSIIRDHGNHHVTVDATGGTLYLGYQNTTGLNILNGKAIIDDVGSYRSVTGLVVSGDTNGSFCRLNPNGNITATGGVYVDTGVIRSKNTYDNNVVTGAPNMYITSSGNIRRTTGTSSERYKKDIKEVENKELQPERLYDIEVKQFKYKDKYQPNENDMRYNKELIGFIAEQVAEVYPIAVDYEYDEDGNRKIDNWNERYIIPPMLKLIQDLNNRVKELELKLKNQGGA